MTIRIKNWKKFQHYKNRRPPWIKLHREVFDDLEFHEMDAEDFRYLVFLWIIASEDKEMDGNLPAIKSLAWRLHISIEKMIGIVRRLNEWIIYDASDMLADCEQGDSAETEKSRVETEKSKDPPIPPKGGGDPKGFTEFWAAYPRKVGKQAARRAWVRARKNGLGELSIEQLVEIIEEHKKSDAWTRENGRFVPNPSTWLNQGRWDDVVAATGAHSGSQNPGNGPTLFTAQEQKMRRQDAILRRLEEEGL
jgi:hypothetical protein